MKKFTFLSFIAVLLFFSSYHATANDNDYPQRLTFSGKEDPAFRISSDLRASTIPFEEKFASGRPDSWTVIDANNDGKTWGFQKEEESRHAGSGFGVACIGDNTGVPGNDWLITPRIAIPAGMDNLIFTFHLTACSDIYFEVRLSETGVEINDFNKLLGYADEKLLISGDTLKGYMGPVYLNNCAGKNLYFAFIDQSPATKKIEMTDIVLRGWHGDATGIDSKEIMNVPLVYAHDHHIYFSNATNPYKAEIFDLSGRLQDSFIVSKSGDSRTVKNKGMYIVVLEHNGKKLTYKIVV